MYKGNDYKNYKWEFSQFGSMQSSIGDISERGKFTGTLSTGEGELKVHDLRIANNSVAYTINIVEPFALELEVRDCPLAHNPQ